jgi:CysZ protein
MKGSFKDSITYFIDGFKLISKPGIRVYVFIPLLINITLFSYATWYSFSIFNEGLNWLLANIPSWLSFIEWILWPLFVLTLGTIIFFIFNILANIIASPFNGMLAEKTEFYLTKQTITSETGVYDFIKTIPHSIAREFYKLKYYFPRFVLLALLSFIPGVNILVFLFAAWMMAVQYLDYPMDNHKISFKDMILLIKDRNLSALGFGAIVMLSLMVPILNFIVIPAAVCGATIFWVEELKDHSRKKLL